MAVNVERGSRSQEASDRARALWQVRWAQEPRFQGKQDKRDQSVQVYFHLAQPHPAGRHPPPPQQFIINIPLGVRLGQNLIPDPSPSSLFSRCPSLVAPLSPVRPSRLPKGQHAHSFRAAVHAPDAATAGSPGRALLREGRGAAARRFDREVARGAGRIPCPVCVA